MNGLAVVGLGYWGPNLVRNALQNPRIEHVVACDRDAARIERVLEQHRSAKACASFDEALADPRVEAVAIATPVFAHYKLAKQALERGKHIIVEKPFASSVDQAAELVDLARKNGCVILVDHTFIYTSAVKKIKELMDAGDIGDVFYYDSVRVNLGLFQHDVNVIWDLAPHDFAIMEFLLDRMPRSVRALGESHVAGYEHENIAYVHLAFDGGMVAHFHLNWLSPVKLRRVLIGGRKKMLVYDDMETADKVKVFDKGVDVKDQNEVYKTLIQYRSGDVHVPQIENTEALADMMDHFVDCVEQGRAPITDGESGLRVTRLLEACQTSLKQNGEAVEV